MKISAKSKYQQRADTTDSVALPQPTFREVPADVNANHARSARAEPAPKSQPSVPQEKARKKQTSKKPSDTGGGDGDSGSDSDGDKRKRGGGSPVQPSRRPKPQPPSDSMATVPRDTPLNAEEEEWLSTRRALNRFEDDWGDRLRYRSHKRAEGEKRRQRLAQEKGQAQPSSELLDNQVRKQHEVLEDYLDESLLSDIAEDRFKDTDNPKASLEVITRLILEAEQRVSEVLYLRNFEFKASLDLPKGYFLDFVEVICRESTLLRHKVKCIPGINSKADMLNWVINRWQPNSEDDMVLPIIYVYLEEIAEKLFNDLITPSQEDLPILGTLGKSRTGACLNPDYIEWVWSRCDPATLKEVLSGDEGYKRQCRKERINRYRERMSAVHVSQEFVLMSDSTVGMALLKNGRVSTFKKVSNEDLKRMGWQRDAGTKSDYWRYAIFKDQPGLVFRVNMDGDTLGLA
ncbi:Snf2 family helicase [Apiospora arundinis]